jgi:shikimate dehydrogenase
MIDSRTRLLGLIGDPVEHSLSPAIHNAALAALGLNYAYMAFRVESRNIDLALAGFRMMGGRGLNVTVPHKTAMLPFMDEMDGAAEKIGAVNTIVFESGRLKGYNTDAPGFSMALEVAGFEPAGKKVVVLGAGGAARAAAFALIDRVSRLFVVTRTASLEKGRRLAAELGGKAGALDFGELASALERASLLVNATSVGMSPRVDETPVAAGLLKPGLAVFDVVYNPMETRLLREARAAGCRTASGLDMLLYQGALSLELWTGHKPSIDIMRQAALEAMGAAKTPSGKKSIALIGFMGSGKSAAGRVLAQRLGMKLLDTDHMVEKNDGRTVAAIFADEGEDFFRRLEVEAVRVAAQAPGVVISCGGGAVLNAESAARLKEAALVIHLEVTPQAALARLGRSRRRPLLAGGDRLATITDMMNRRRALYEGAADITIDTSDMSVEAVVDAIMAALKDRAAGIQGKS